MNTRRRATTNDFTIQIGGQAYTPEDITEGKHLDNPAITAADNTVHNVSNGANVGIQAGAITGDITIKRRR